jgi:pimeloyl-ACP methyl ester carboxylesterase
MPNRKLITTEGFTDISSGRMHYLTWKTGEYSQLHFLHANGFCANVYAPLFEQLAGQYTITASDLRGHGDSSSFPDHRSLRWEQYADDLKDFIESTMTPPVVGAGHSLGAVTTLIAAARYPHLFSRIILIDPVIFPSRFLYAMALLRLIRMEHHFPLSKKARRRKKVFESREDALRRFSAGRGMFRTWRPEFIESYLSCALLIRDDHSALLKCDPELEARIYETVPGKIWSYISKITLPLLAIRGELSDTFFRESAEKIGRIVPGAVIVEVPGAGHFVPMEEPDRVAALIRTFISPSGRD